MRNTEQRYQKPFLAVSLLATLFVVTETVLQSIGKSICYSEGCKVVSQQVRFGDISILLIGLLTFGLLSFLTARSAYRGSTGYERLITIIMVASLAAEGFFAGYQAFSIQKACIVCLIILSFVVILGLIRLLGGDREIVAGFASFAVVFSLLFLILPVTAKADLPAQDRLILFYSKECKHCAEIMKELEERKISVTHLLATDHAGFLTAMRIEHVPTLLVNDPNQKLLLTGTEAIRRYLQACTADKKSDAPAGSKPKVKQEKKTSSGAGPAINIFSQPAILAPADQPPLEAGACKEDAACKE